MVMSVAPKPTATKVKILVVEDESIIAADIRDCLENLGYAVAAIASDGENAVQLAETLQPDLVLMDIRLQGKMDGIQAAQQIWACSRIPVVYASGYSDHSTMERAKETGPFGYVLKPIEERELYVAIETALQRHRLNQEMESREQWLFSVLRAIGDGVIVVDVHSRVRFLNAVAEALTGWRRDEAIGKNLADVFHLVHEDTQRLLPSPMDDALQTGNIEYMGDKTLLHSRTGQTVPVANSAAPFCDDTGTITGVVLVFHDMTDRRQAEERNLAIARSAQLESQMVELQALNQLKDDFLNTVSHELRTPLTNIKMAIRMLELTLNQRASSLAASDLDSRTTSRYLKILSEQCDRQTDLVNDLLDLQRLNADAYTIDLSTVYLQRFLPEIVDYFQERALSQQQQLHVALAPLPPIVTDASSLNRILSELVNNAVKYTPSGERINITVRTIERTPSTASMIQIQVCNSGVEIPETELPRIFDQFYRIPSADRWRQGGTGLGLTREEIGQPLRRFDSSDQWTATNLFFSRATC
jgi:PAS domain S-box-containing protein